MGKEAQEKRSNCHTSCKEIQGRNTWNHAINKIVSLYRIYVSKFCQLFVHHKYLKEFDALGFSLRK